MTTGGARTATGNKFAQPGMRMRIPASCVCRRGLVEDAI